MWLAKAIFSILITAILLAMGSIPPGLAYMFWQWIAPETELGRIALGLGMLFFGGGITVAIWIGLFALWGAAMAGVFSTRSRRW